MPSTETYRVTVELMKDYEFAVHFDDVPGAPVLICDEPAPLGGDGGPNAAALLAAAVGNCLAASLAFCLRRARLEPVTLSAQVTTRTARSDKGRVRIAGIDVVLSPQFGVAGCASQKRCEALFEDFCTVTASIRHGIPVSVSMSDNVCAVG